MVALFDCVSSMGESGFHDHFDDRQLARISSGGISRSGRRSPTSHSDHSVLIRTSLLKVSEGKKAKKIRFYRNGDRFFQGMVYAVSPERFRTFESLLAELTNSPICDKNVMPQGVRHMFTLDGSRKVVSLDELEEGESYVCACTDLFRRLDYARSCSSPNWSANRKFAGREATPGGGSGGGEVSRPLSTRAEQQAAVEDEIKDFIKPKLVTVIRNGSKPRKAVRVLLNRKTAQTFDQVLTDITEAIKLDSGAVRRIYTLDGRQVMTLADFFKDESVFIAYGQERLAADDFDLDVNEVRHVSAYRSAAVTAKPRDRVTLRSPKSPRRSTPPSREGSRNGSESPKMGLSPKLPRKLRTVSAPKYRQVNGNASQKEDGMEDVDGIPGGLLESYEIGNVIGEGNFAIVKECLDRSTGRKFALKIIEKSKCKGKEHAVFGEVAILRLLKHPNIVQLVADFDRPDALYLVMELVKGGDLFDAISSATKYTERDASGMLYNLTSALKYLHSLSIVHRDIKPENILVCDHGVGSTSLKLGDFGLATEATKPLYTVCGTPTYVAPEILAEVGYGVKVDIWSAGVITYILLCGFPPFVSATEDQDELFDLILACKLDFPSPFWDFVSEPAKDLIYGMLELDPEKRFTAQEVMQHPWVSQDDVARDRDLHDNVAKQLTASGHLAGRKRSGMAGIRLIMSTPLDKGSRYFQGRGNAPLALQPHGQDEVSDDEIF